MLYQIDFGKGERMKIYTLVGTIGSGKSTWAKNFIETHPSTRIVCADDFRKMFYGLIMMKLFM